MKLPPVHSTPDVYGQFVGQPGTEAHVAEVLPFAPGLPVPQLVPQPAVLQCQYLVLGLSEVV